MRKILIRFDDFCPTMDWKQWTRAELLCEQYHIKPLIGVIPDCIDENLMIDNAREDFWDYVKSLQNKGYKIAMHGFHHEYDIKKRGCVSNGFCSEFAGHPYELQNEKIRHGKEILNSFGICTDVFFAPAHSYDINTIKALHNNGFKYISDGKSIKPINRYGVICIPCRYSGTPKIKKNGYYTAVYHTHEWSRPEKSHGYDNLHYVCESFHQDIVPWEDYVNRNCGALYVQVLSEIINVFYQRYCVPVKIKVVEKLKRNK